MTVAGRKVIVFDFDGTLVESVGIKDEAMRAVFADEPDHLPAIMEYHLAHNHVLRFEKFRYITETILGRPYTDAVRDRLLAAFSTRVRDAIIAAPEVPGTTEALRDLKGRAPLYLLSMTPDEELDAILVARGLRPAFTDVYGGTWTKVAAIADILRREGLSARDAVMVGDVPEDFAAARSAGIAFIGRDSGKSFPPEAGPARADMTGVHADLRAFLGD